MTWLAGDGTMHSFKVTAFGFITCLCQDEYIDLEKKKNIGLPRPLKTYKMTVCVNHSLDMFTNITLEHLRTCLHSTPQHCHHANPGAASRREKLYKVCTQLWVTSTPYLQMFTLDRPVL